MSVRDYKEAIMSMVEATDDETLLEHWKKRLEHDMENRDAIALSEEEWNLVQEGMADYKNGNVMTLKEFAGKRK